MLINIKEWIVVKLWTPKAVISCKENQSSWLLGVMVLTKETNIGKGAMIGVDIHAKED
jgi:hypothetical protein